MISKSKLLEEFHNHGIDPKKSPYFLPVFQKMHWKRLHIAQKLVLENSSFSSNYMIGDFGCGLGIFSRFLSRQFRYSNIFCLDNNNSLTFAQKLTSSDNAKFCICNIQNIPLKSNSFDFIVSLDVLEHVDDPIIALKEIHRVLKEDGFFIVSVPLETSLLKIIREITIKLNMSTRMPTNYSHYHGEIKNFKEFEKELGCVFKITKKQYSPLNLFRSLNYGCAFVCKKQ